MSDQLAGIISLGQEILNDRWLSIELLGRGTFANVFLVYDLAPKQVYEKRMMTIPQQVKQDLRGVQHSTKKPQAVDVGRFYALKCFEPTEVAAEAFENEERLMRQFSGFEQHGHIPLVDSFREMINRVEHCMIVMPLCMGSILTPIENKGTDIATARQILQQVFTAAMIIHENGMAHGDVKPENILVDGVTTGVLRLAGAIDKRIDLSSYVGRPRQHHELLRKFRGIMSNISADKQQIENIPFDMPVGVRVRLADFGTCVPAAHGYNSKNTIYYSGLEGVFGVTVPDNRQTDIVALAATAWEIVTGNILFNWSLESKNAERQTNSMLKRYIKTLGYNDKTIELIRESRFYDNELMVCGIPKGLQTFDHKPLMDRMSKHLGRNVEESLDHVAFVHMIYCMLEFDPKARPNLRMVCNHPFFTECGAPQMPMVAPPSGM
jgi:serine/threonine protein kinase